MEINNRRIRRFGKGGYHVTISKRFVEDSDVLSMDKVYRVRFEEMEDVEPSGSDNGRYPFRTPDQLVAVTV